MINAEVSVETETTREVGVRINNLFMVRVEEGVGVQTER
jgi:hypothetical protein